LRVSGSVRLCDQAAGRLTLRISQKRLRAGRLRAAASSTRLVELASAGCRTLGFRFWVTGKLAGPGRYVFALRASDAGGASAAYVASHRTRR